MTGNSDTTSTNPDVEFRRQLRSGQLRRFIGTLPSYSVQPDLPERFVKLLRKLDRVSGREASSPGDRRPR